MANIEELFGSSVFNDAVMQKRLPKDIYKALHKTITDGTPLDPQVANVVANAMKDWAVERGVTHYTHWFQPLTGITAEKHDSFISPKDGGKIILEFSGKELVRGEPDASSFPSGGLRSTFEARGYTAWDPTSYAFIKDGVLCIPTAFCSYGGEALDQKTPLLRSMEALSTQAVRVLKLFGRDATRVTSTVGPEQEYFLVDKALYDQRKDLIFTGRTLFGNKPPKGQELEDHYFGSIKPRVQAFMTDLNEELWKLGILAKTEHNEVAPAQHELAPIFSITSVATDHNQLTMEMMKKIAQRHGLVCLLHEKPFAGVNGSGKHNNWSMSTNTGYNLLDPGDDPATSAQFMLILTAVIKAVDEYADLLRISVASAGNDHRLGANEAPPAIISMFLGDELSAIVNAFEEEKEYCASEKHDLEIGVSVLPKFPKDNTDRNRTSPFAFTGNKFEFRSLGSSESIAEANVVINTIVAQSLKEFADELESAENFRETLHNLIVSNLRKHNRIIFNGNGYAPEWVEEAARRGLPNYVSTVDALPHMLDEKNIKLFTTFGVFTEAEIRSRYEIKLENYAKVLNIEAETCLMMAEKEILPACMKFAGATAKAVNAMKTAGVEPYAEAHVLADVAERNAKLYKALEGLRGAVKATCHGDALECAKYEHNVIIPAMAAVREQADELETLQEKTQGIYYGIGARVSLDTETQLPKIASVISGTPAEEAGLMANDLLYKADDTELQGMDLSSAVALIRGEEGTSVHLTVIRSGESNYLEFDVVRRKLANETVTSKMLDDSMAYIQIQEFDDVTLDQFTEALDNARSEGMEGLIIDLRGNPGGNLSTVCDICRELLPKGLIVYTEDKYGNREEYSCDGTNPLEVPLVVLVDGNSASASEIMSGAVKDYGIGTLVGTTTYGKGIVQRIMQLTDNSAVKLTVSKYYTPKGNNIHKIGIEPDVEVEFDAQAYVEDGTDNQLNKAMEVLQEKMAK